MEDIYCGNKKVGKIYRELEKELIDGIKIYVEQFDGIFELSSKNNTEYMLKILDVHLEDPYNPRDVFAKFIFTAPSSCKHNSHDHGAFINSRSISEVILKIAFNLDAYGDERLTIDFDEKQGTFTANWNPDRYKHDLEPPAGGMNFGLGGGFR